MIEEDRERNYNIDRQRRPIRCIDQQRKRGRICKRQRDRDKERAQDWI